MCAEAGCDAPGEFRAPLTDGFVSGRDGPGEYRYLCLDHVRAFNAKYNFFNGMSPDEIHDAQRPYAGWEREGAKAMLTQPLEVIAEAVVKNNINPQPRSGRQERLENLWNQAKQSPTFNPTLNSSQLWSVW